jgi:MFS family permease
MTSDATSVSGGLGRRRWLVLGVVDLAQLMVVLDLTIMNIALPSAQRALHFTTLDRQWVVTAYALAFGSLLLLGGRLADLLGRRVTFLIGLVGFAGVSAIGGASRSFIPSGGWRASGREVEWWRGGERRPYEPSGAIPGDAAQAGDDR